MKKYIFILSLLLLSCSKKDNTGDYIARVNDSYLTADDVIEILETRKNSISTSKDIAKSVITNWVKDEILYQKAKKEHFDKDKKIKNQVDEYFRSLVIDEYLKYHFQSTVSISNSEIEKFYNDNIETYRLDKDALKILHVFVEDYNDANTIKSTLQSLNPDEKKELYANYEFETRVVKKGEVVKDIDVELFERSLSSVVGPISSNYGFHIVEVREKYKAGDYLPLNIVRDDIYERLMQQKNKSEYIFFTDSIFSIADFEIKEDKLEGLIK